MTRAFLGAGQTPPAKPPVFPQQAAGEQSTATKTQAGIR